MEVMSLRKLAFSPEANPLLQGETVPIKSRHVRSGLAARTLVDAATGEVIAKSVIQVTEEKDDREFVKVFVEGIKATYSLSKTALRVFQCVLEEYEKSPMRGGYADTVSLTWFDGGLSGRDIGMSNVSFYRGLKELLAKGFLAPKIPNTYWVNPALFFKGDAVSFVKEYRRRSQLHLSMP